MTDQQRITELEAEVGRLKAERDSARDACAGWLRGHNVQKQMLDLATRDRDQLRSALREAVVLIKRFEATAPSPRVIGSYTIHVADLLSAVDDSGPLLARLRPLVDAQNDVQDRAIPGSESESGKSGSTGAK